MPEPIVIAVIDDDNSFRVALAEALSAFGFQIEEYASAVHFIAETRNSLCNVVVTDVNMPGMSGLDLARRLAGSDWKVPIVLITARSDVSVEAGAADVGIVCLLRKPFAIADLIKCIENALEI